MWLVSCEVMPTASDRHIEDAVLRATGASDAFVGDVVQSLWSGYGQIVRCGLVGVEAASVIVKRVQWPTAPEHPRGWATNRSHARKLTSYRVEATWYQQFAQYSGDHCRVPECLAIETTEDGVLIVLEDLDDSGFSERRRWLDDHELDACLSWLANFHATFMGVSPQGLWPTGTYWHLDTRPDELDALDDGPLKDAAAEIDRRLSASPFQTLVHGDAKVANFCFAPRGERVAAVDFQYVGGGCGMKDVAYFIGSCLDEDDSERLTPELLDRYFGFLAASMGSMRPDVDAVALEEDWRTLYPLAWTDFHRFLKGWSPGHWKLNSYSERVARNVIDSLGEQ